MIFNYDANKIYFHNKGFALSLVLKVRFFGTRKWPIRLCDCGIVPWVLLKCLTDCSWNLSFITLGGPQWLMNLFRPPKELPLDTKESGSCYRNDEISHKSPAGKRRAARSLNMDFDHSIWCLWVSFAHTTNLYYRKEALVTRKVTRNVFVFFLFVFNAKCLLVEYWRLYYAHWTQRWLNQGHPTRI